jgi:cbb3-type cytochrome oxidase maturation protein
VEILYLLVPLSIGIAFAIVAALAWSVWNGQFDDLDRQAGRMLDLGETRENTGADDGVNATPTIPGAINTTRPREPN